MKPNSIVAIVLDKTVPPEVHDGMAKFKRPGETFMVLETSFNKEVGMTAYRCIDFRNNDEFTAYANEVQKVFTR